MMRDATMTELISQVADDEVPEPLVDAETRERLHEFQHHLETSKLTFESYFAATGQTPDKLIEMLQMDARRVRQGRPRPARDRARRRASSPPRASSTRSSRRSRRGRSAPPRGSATELEPLGRGWGRCAPRQVKGRPRSGSLSASRSSTRPVPRSTGRSSRSPTTTHHPGATRGLDDGTRREERPVSTTENLPATATSSRRSSSRRTAASAPTTCTRGC